MSISLNSLDFRMTAAEIITRDNEKEQAGNLSLDQVEFDAGCNYEVLQNGEYKLQPSKIADILISGVNARYMDHNSNWCNKTFWVVMLKTKNCYNFGAHLMDLMQLHKKKCFGQTRDQSRFNTEVYDLWNQVLLHSQAMSPSAQHYFRENGLVHIDPVQSIMQPGKFQILIV
jgi:hypothetical protein